MTARRLAILTGLVAAIGGAAPARDVCHLFAGETRMAHQILIMPQEKRTRDIRVPDVYIEGDARDTDGREARAIFFSVSAEDFVPVHGGHEHAVRRAGREPLKIVLLDLVPLERRLTAALVLSQPERGRTSPDFVEDPAAAFTAGAGPFGLTVYAPDGENEAWKEVFAAVTPDGKIGAVLTCDPVGRVAEPRCAHDLRADGIDARVFYSRRLLPEWRQVGADVAAFVGCAVRAAG